MLYNPIKKGIILAGGRGTRLYPATSVLSKLFLPIYYKPIIYYPLATLMEMGIREIMIISTPLDLPRFEALFGDGNRLGLRFRYAEQPSPEGIAQAYLIGREFIGDDPVALILGDNFFSHYQAFRDYATKFKTGAVIFGRYVQNARRYGVIEMNHADQIKSLVEKPRKSESNYAMTGLYLADARVCEIAEKLKPSKRGELEIVDVMNNYLSLDQLHVWIITRGVDWIDAGTPSSLQTASWLVQKHEEKTGKKLACLEEIAYRRGYIDDAQVNEIIDYYIESEYGEYLFKRISEIRKRKENES